VSNIEQVNQALAPTIVEEAPLALILTDEGIKQFEAQVEFYRRFITACYKLTQPAHWVNHGSATEPKYSLQGPGAEALSTPLGIYEDPPIIREVKRHDDKGEFYAFEVEGIMHSRTLKRYGWFVGECTSRDQFFTAKGGFEPERDKHLIRNSALTNWRVNGVCRLAGMRNPDPETLKAAGLDLSKVPAIEYKRGFKEATLSDSAKPKLDEIRAWLMLLCNNDATVAKNRLKELTAFKDFSGVDDPKKLSEKQIAILHPKVRALVEAQGKTANTGEREPGSDDK
jgi:hypothetical protein